MASVALSITVVVAEGVHIAVGCDRHAHRGIHPGTTVTPEPLTAAPGELFHPHVVADELHALPFQKYTDPSVRPTSRPGCVVTLSGSVTAIGSVTSTDGVEASIALLSEYVTPVGPLLTTPVIKVLVVIPGR